MVIIVLGLPGSGKSYFAARLALKLQAGYINSDELRLKLFANRRYTDAEKMLVYESMLAIMSDTIRRNKPIVLDATFYKEAIRNKFEETAGKLGEKIIYIEITAPESIIADRLKKPRTYSEANFTVYLKLIKIFEPLTKEHLLLTSSNTNISSMLTEALNYINTVK